MTWAAPYLLVSGCGLRGSSLESLQCGAPVRVIVDHGLIRGLIEASTAAPGVFLPLAY